MWNDLSESQEPLKPDSGGGSVRHRRAPYRRAEKIFSGSSNDGSVADQDGTSSTVSQDERQAVQSPKDMSVTTGRRSEHGPPTFSLKEVEQHKSPESTWVIYENKVYDITSYIASGAHPGGNSLLLSYAGDDLTEAFKDIGHSNFALQQMQKFFIGFLEGYVPEDFGENEPVEPVPRHDRDCIMDGVDFRKPLVRQIYKTTKQEYVSLTEKYFCSTSICDFFESPLLEFFSRTAWWVVPTLWLPVAALLLIHTHRTYHVASRTAALLFFVGVLAWSLSEYLIHRFLFHFPESSLPDYGVVRVIHFLGHGVHHLLPMDPMRLVMPPALLVILMSPFYLLFSSVLPAWLLRSAWAGVLTGYVCYDVIHYASHYFAVDALPYLRFMKGYHMKHHFRTPTKAFGVSSPFWDYVFGTVIV